jgi:uncharacterized protein YdeI (YjbR/CyaY-like superfamily)
VEKVKKCYATNVAEFEDWFENNHLNEDKMILICNKRHTGKPSLSHREALEVAICFGWIDTVVKRIDDEKFIRTFVKRKLGAGWSKNTLGYAAKLVKEGRMRTDGLRAYERGKKKVVKGSEIHKSQKMPYDMRNELKKSGMLDKFMKIAPSYQRFAIYWVDSGKRRETRENRIKIIVDKVRRSERIL